MSILNNGKTIALSLAVAVVSVATIGGSASAAMIQYNPGGMGTTSTPVFNTFYDVPGSVGNEAEFVMVKTKAGGNTDYKKSLTATCKAGDVYTVRTYVHNGASPDYNQNGSGTAVAHGVVVSMKAPVGTEASKFSFISNVSATNAAGVTAEGSLNCASSKKLALVASSVQTYSKNIGYNSAPDSSVNGRLSIGSRAQGSGDQWACWDDRIIVTYDVTVSDIPTPPQPPTPKPTPTPTPKPVTPTTPIPAEMPKTGAEGIGLLFAGTTATGIAARELITRRRK